jgi:hypothetical protein
VDIVDVRGIIHLHRQRLLIVIKPRRFGDLIG